MATIGSFTASKDGYMGTIRTLTINVKASIVANDKKASEGAPDFRVYAGPAELGAAWKSKTNDNQSREYLSVLLDDPSFSNPIRAALFEEEGTAFLVWNRREG
ncbi:hypothetical protein B0E33_19070 [Roseibium algicola]|uniref:DUF736 domain-containing protein n=1 Tax=Roseibium algicola TaxID=2857014 RepID=A0ABN4WUP7_9HYPH|nr:DUF736 domain-containing protein [Roseibium aggregatum]AQQ05414.1 hypothetical protein B0E33_19070 [Roseibium aggregatum]